MNETKGWYLTPTPQDKPSSKYLLAQEDRAHALDVTHAQPILRTERAFDTFR